MVVPTKRKVILSENEDEAQENVGQPRNRGRRKTRPSEKQAQLAAEDLEAQQKKLDALQRELKRREREIVQARKAQATTNPPSDDEDEFESEEEHDNRPFSSSIQPLKAIYEAPSQPHGQLRRIGPAAAFSHSRSKEAPHVSARAFKTLPSSAEPELDKEASASSEAQDNDQWQLMSTHSSSPPGAAAAASTTMPLQPTTSPNVEAKVPAFRTGVIVNPKKPKAADYEDIVQALILRAASEYEALVSTKDAFPNTGTRHKWALKAWKNANQDAKENYGLTDAINSLIRQRGSRIRGHALSEVRPYLISMLGFKKGSDASTIIANQQLTQKLKPADGPQFPFKSPDDRSGYGKAKIISAIIDSVWFEDARSQGIIFEKLFSPIPLETMALVFTIIDFCIDEWSTGRFVKAKMWESNVIERHKVFRMDLEGWSQINQIAVAGIRKKLYLRASRNAGVVDISATKQTLIGDVLERAKQELDGRTGETDSEAEN